MEISETSVRHDRLQAGLDKPNAVVEFFTQSLAISQVEFLKLSRDFTEIFSRAVQPVLWLAVFGQVMAKVRGISTGGISYEEFMTPGILAQSVLFSAIFYGISVIWERDMGVVHKLLVSPAQRAALVIGKAVSAGFRGIVQAAIIYLIAIVLGVGIRLDVPSIFGVFCAVILGSAIFSTFSLVIACIVKTRERFMGIGQVLTMPLFFASSALYPVELMPSWLQFFAKVNPLTYLVDSLRVMMVQAYSGGHNVIFDFLVLSIVFLVLVVTASKLYPTLVQ